MDIPKFLQKLAARKDGSELAKAIGKAAVSPPAEKKASR
jgi:hypothetical protein